MMTPKEMGRLMSGPAGASKLAASSLQSDSSDLPMSPSSVSSFASNSLANKGDGKECHICGEKFGKVSNKRKVCANCSQPVCQNHSLKKRELPGSQKLQRVCDSCDEELIKREIREEMESQIRDLEVEIKKTTEENERRARENRDKTMILSNLEYEISKAEKTHKQKEQTLLDRLSEEQQKNEKARSTIEKLQRDLEESHKSETTMADRCKEIDKQIETVNGEAQALRERKEELAKHLQDLEGKIKSSVPLSHLKTVACGACKTRLENMYRPRKSAVGESATEAEALSEFTVPPSPGKSREPIQSSKGCRADCAVM